jgi:hypothetical protein
MHIPFLYPHSSRPKYRIKIYIYINICKIILIIILLIIIIIMIIITYIHISGTSHLKRRRSFRKCKRSRRN